jgi:UDP-glucose 4-epimerase
LTKTLLVSGGAGYVGSHTVVDLLSRGHKVIVFDNLCQGHRQAVPKEAIFVHGELGKPADIAAVFKAHRVDAILHFAAHALVGESMMKPLRYVGENVGNALNLVEAAVENKVRKFVLSSTCAIFGTPERVPIDEETPKAPVNPYGEGKLMVERILQWMDQAHGLRSACLRYFNASGAHPTVDIGECHDPETHLIPIALDVALGKRPQIDVYGTDYPTPDGTCVRDYIHVCDLADAHVRLLDALDEKSRHYNVGTGRGYSVREVLAAVRRVTGAKVPERVAPRRAGDPPVLVAAPDLIRRELGWQPRFSEIDEIVATAWKWRRAHPHGFEPAQAAD